MEQISKNVTKLTEHENKENENKGNTENKRHACALMY